MALSNAERQARYRQRRKAAAAAGKPPPTTPAKVWQVFMLGVFYGALQARSNPTAARDRQFYRETG